MMTTRINGPCGSDWGVKVAMYATLLAVGGATYEAMKLAAQPKPDPFHHQDAQRHLNATLPGLLSAFEPRSETLKRGWPIALKILEQTPGDYGVIFSALRESLGSDSTTISNTIRSFSIQERNNLSSDMFRLAQILRPLAGQLSDIAPAVFPVYHEFGRSLARFADSLEAFSQALLRKTLDFSQDAARGILSDLRLAPRLDR